MIKYHGTAQDLVGDAIPGATAQVKNHITGINAPLYEDDEVTPKANPLTCDSSGRFSFKSPAGLVDIVVSADGFSATLTEISLIEDPSLIYMVNDEGSSLSYGDAVYISGSGEVKKGQSDGTEDESNIVGICVDTILADGSTGRFKTIGSIDRISTPGEIGYLSASGVITASPPSTGFVTALGRQVSNSKFFVSIELSIELVP